MRTFKFIAPAALALLLSAYRPLPTEKAVSDFKLLATTGRMVTLADYPKAKGFMVVFTCNHCPFAKVYFNRLNDLSKKYGALGVPLLAISSSDTVNFEEDGYGKMKEKTAKEHLTFPYLYDGSQATAVDFGAKKTPHAFVVWKENGKLVVKYAGAIDDNGAEPEKVVHHYLAEAVDALLAGKAVDVPETKSVGCTLGIRAKK